MKTMEVFDIIIAGLVSAIKSFEAKVMLSVTIAGVVVSQPEINEHGSIYNSLDFIGVAGRAIVYGGGGGAIIYKFVAGAFEKWKNRNENGK